VSAVKATTASDRRPAAASAAPRPAFPETTTAPAARGSHARRRAAAPGVAAHGQTKTFATPHGKVRAVRGVDLHLAPGVTVALLGPNGAGKSTTIDLLLGLGRPDRGTVTIFGETPAAAVAAGRVAAMLQTGELIRDLSVREIVQMIAALYPAPRDVDAVLETAGLTSIAGQRTQKLSGGERQRVRFAAALASGAALLVLDEPTVGMDVEARHGFWQTIRAAAASGTTVIFATHYLEEADAYADRVVLLAGGKVVADGPATEIKARVGQRVIRATLAAADLEELRRLPGVSAAERHGAVVVLTCGDSDAALRALLSGFAEARDIEIAGAGLEQAFLELTGDDAGSPRGALHEGYEAGSPRGALPDGNDGGSPAGAQTEARDSEETA
jgi:ABC-2 type transport system ATP-binding protein